MIWPLIAQGVSLVLDLLTLHYSSHKVKDLDVLVLRQQIRIWGVALGNRLRCKNSVQGYERPNCAIFWLADTRRATRPFSSSKPINYQTLFANKLSSIEALEITVLATSISDFRVGNVVFGPYGLN